MSSSFETGEAFVKKVSFKPDELRDLQMQRV
jgi:hypothetical protein